MNESNKKMNNKWKIIINNENSNESNSNENEKM